VVYWKLSYLAMSMKTRLYICTSFSKVWLGCRKFLHSEKRTI
jgi:hypothetical protein